MKKQLAVFAAIAALGVTSALAAHPFSDVTAKDWAYQAVERLAAEGVIEGYPDGTFKGQRNITRYEMAQMIARADAHKDEVTAEQKATIQRLANEFANELQAFGVRVNKLEDKVGNFKFSGDARVRYQNVNSKKVDEVKASKSNFDYRARLKFEGILDDQTKVGVRVGIDDVSFQHDDTSDVKNQGAEAKFDEVYIQHQLRKEMVVTFGRKDHIIGNGLIYDDVFRGVKVEFGPSYLHGVLGYGYIQHNKKAVTVYELQYQPKNFLSVKGFYLDRHSDNERYNPKTNSDVFGGALDFTFGHDNKLWLGGEYARKASKGSDGEAWIAGIGYGKADINVAGSWGIKAQYYNFGKDTFVKHTGYKVPSRAENYGYGHANYKAWLGTVDYILKKNIALSAYTTIRAKSQNGQKEPNFYRLDLNYQF